MIDFLISDKDVSLLISLNNYISTSSSNIRICNICNNIVDTLNRILVLKPTIIILGLSFTNVEIKKILYTLGSSIDYSPYVIRLKKNNAYMKTTYNNYYEVVSNPSNFDALSRLIHNVVPQINDTFIREYTINELIKLNFNISSIGTKYLIDCIVLAQKYPYLLENLENRLYQKVSLLHITTSQHVKWNINKCIDSMFRYSKDSFLMNYFSFYEKRKPTAKIIITTIINKYERQQLKKLS